MGCQKVAELKTTTLAETTAKQLVNFKI